MAVSRRHLEYHRADRVAWLRAAVLGANDGIVSTASLLMGVAAAHASHHSIVMTGVAGLVAGAMSMAAGEFVSVHSQADTEKADLAREQAELSANPGAELKELAGIYVKRGLHADLANQVAVQLMQHDALGAHARDELGMSPAFRAQPVQAALASAAAFSIGAALPVAVAAFAPTPNLLGWMAAGSLVFLAMLGALAGWAGGTSMATSVARVSLWGALAMAITAGVGALFGAVA